MGFFDLFSSRPVRKRHGHRVSRVITCEACNRRMSPKEYVEHAGLKVRGGTAQCRFCHLWIPVNQAWKHEREHKRRRLDGQQVDHITLPEKDRFLGSLTGVPCVYEHDRCGARTGMPEEIIRSYLANPFLYNGFTFCTGCGDYVSENEVRWVETEQTLQAYKDQLRREWCDANGDPPCPWS